MVHLTKMSQLEVISGMVGSRNSKPRYWIWDFSSIFGYFFPFIGSIFWLIFPMGHNPLATGLNLQNFKSVSINKSLPPIIPPNFQVWASL